MKDFLEYTQEKMNSDIVCIEDDCPQDRYCGRSALPECPQTTIAYIPFQTDTTMYDPEMALKCGTAYPDLNKPFLGGRCI